MFKIECMKCNAITQVSTKDISGGLWGAYHELVFDNENITIGPSGYDGEIKIICKCGNKLVEGQEKQQDE